ncbi:nuclear transport factor 2 family protein [Pseudomonas sp. GD03860]|uniref:nuclear transport factor 2 family protein n=1 Tax=Pseudomonas TaxID=286 RepID=UPI00236354AF|nr:MULTISPECIES: nuclear transport factor 2 family protein [Pseudomonas]MDD2056468.1 nuclear transport factor 2 family protein [Pseudomonas putida]MDH0638833.1 nuclear transport factor 2 family protein [Pseudomonas sp. GD03860]
MTPTDQLETRLRMLEDAEAIRRLKARYLACCDLKDAQGMRDCFAPGPVRIDYGRIGEFEDRDQLVAIFQALGCHPHVVEMHHGVNPQIDVLDHTQARGTWGLHYQRIDTRSRVITQLGAYYEDEYRKVDGQWKISATRCVVTSTLEASYADTAPGVRFAGIQPIAMQSTHSAAQGFANE